MQLALDGLDRLVASLEERGSLPAVEAARLLFASRSVPAARASSLLAEVCADDSRIDVTGLRVGLILTGGNVDLDALPWMKK